MEFANLILFEKNLFEFYNLPSPSEDAGASGQTAEQGDHHFTST